jgi:hypothetical protein
MNIAYLYFLFAVSPDAAGAWRETILDWVETEACIA